MLKRWRMQEAIMQCCRCIKYKITPDLKKCLTVRYNWEALSLRGYVGDTSERQVVSTIVDGRMSAIAIGSSHFSLAISRR